MPSASSAPSTPRGRRRNARAGGSKAELADLLPGPIGAFLERSGLNGKGKSRKGGGHLAQSGKTGEKVLEESKRGTEGQRPSVRPTPEEKALDPEETFSTPNKGEKRLSLSDEAMETESPAATPDAMESILQGASAKAAAEATSDVVKKIDFGRAQRDAKALGADASPRHSSSSSVSSSSRPGDTNSQPAAQLTNAEHDAVGGGATPPPATAGAAVTSRPAAPVLNPEQQTVTDKHTLDKQQTRAPTTIAKKRDTDRKRVKTDTGKGSERVATRTPVKTITKSGGESSKRKITPQSPTTQ
jgi:hypothetical protein